MQEKFKILFSSQSFKPITSVSFFKRKAKVKDTGSILPGHGGLLDRIDGIIFTLPVAFIIDKLLY